MIPANYTYKTREEWLRAAVDLINRDIYGGEMDIVEYQISPALLGKTKLGETVMPYQGENVGLDDFFPPTIHVDEKIKGTGMLIAVIAHEMIHAFKDIKKHGKAFGAVAGPVGFEKPYAKLSTNEDLTAKCKEIAHKLGPYPGVPVKPAEKEKKPKTFSGKIFCPECGYELRVKEKAFKKYGLPTCSCGAKMALDMEDIDTPPTDETEK